MAARAAPRHRTRHSARALAFFAGSRGSSHQMLAHAGLPLLRLTWPRTAASSAARAGRSSAAAPLRPARRARDGLGGAAADRAARGRRPPGPARPRPRADGRSGEPGTVVRGGIVITADDVTVRGVTVRRRRERDRGRRRGRASSSRTSSSRAPSWTASTSAAATSRSATARSALSRHATRRGSTSRSAFDRDPSIVERCTVVGGHGGDRHPLRHACVVRDNHVSSTELRAITMTEMSMGKIEDNEVDGALGVGIFCGDYSSARSTTTTCRGRDAGPRRRATACGYGVAIQAHYGAEAELDGQRDHAAARAVSAPSSDATIDARGLTG